jgi:hypothetical protein
MMAHRVGNVMAHAHADVDESERCQIAFATTSPDRDGRAVGGAASVAIA